jgi:4-hydroxybenzoate polyprenyltransferase
MIYQYTRLFRVPQWIKNSFVFVPLLFSQNLFEWEYFLTVLSAFFLFSLVSSMVYIINDIVDIEADRAHPKKKNRPLASGAVTIKNAVISLILISILSVSLLFFFNIKFIIVLASYLILNIFYSTIFKHIVLLDVFSIAAGFMLRVLGGAFVIDVYLSSWLILTTMFISLFLGVMKRHSELYLAAPETESNVTRKVLSYYSHTFTQQMATVAASGVVICYALYTVAPRTISVFGTEDLIFTTPFVVFGIFRYMFLVYINQQGENTTDIMISDIPMIVNIFLYLASVVFIVYFI